jgi:TusA-related sulfurtransferase
LDEFRLGCDHYAKLLTEMRIAHVRTFHDNDVYPTLAPIIMRTSPGATPDEGEIFSNFYSDAGATLLFSYVFRYQPHSEVKKRIPLMEVGEFLKAIIDSGVQQGEKAAEIPIILGNEILRVSRDLAGLYQVVCNVLSQLSGTVVTDIHQVSKLLSLGALLVVEEMQHQYHVLVVEGKSYRIDTDSGYAELITNREFGVNVLDAYYPPKYTYSSTGYVAANLPTFARKFVTTRVIVAPPGSEVPNISVPTVETTTETE